MLTNSSITLETIFEQCNDPENLNPENNFEPCVACFQGIYAEQEYVPALEELATVIRKIWGDQFTARQFRTVLTEFRKADGSQAFDTHSINQVAARLYRVSIVKHFDYPQKMNTIPNAYEERSLGVIGVSGLITKVVASSDVTDHGIKYGSTDGSEWKIGVQRPGEGVTLLASFLIHNPEHINPQRLRNVEYVLNPPFRINEADKIFLGVYLWYRSHNANIENTSFDLYIEKDVIE